LCFVDTHTQEKKKRGGRADKYKSHALVRHGIRRLCTNPLGKEKKRHPEQHTVKKRRMDDDDNKLCSAHSVWSLSMHIIVIESQSKTLLPVVEKRGWIYLCIYVSLDPGH
jgi:hypothetical protein